MGNTGMVGMGNQMVPPYGAAMPGQMGNMGMGSQVRTSIINHFMSSCALFLSTLINYFHLF